MKKLMKLSMLSSGLMALGIMASSGVNAQGACSVAYDTVNSWGNGGQYKVTLTNTGAAKTGWELCWTFAGNDVIPNLWDGVLTQTGKNVCVKNAPYNPNLAANGTATFGFLVNNPGTIPTVFTLNGAACGGTASSVASSTPSSTPSSVPSSTPSSRSSSSAAGTAARWLLDSTNSTFNFVTVKKNTAGTETPESMTFTQLQGTVSTTGQATLTIPLASISSGVDLRNTRLQSMLFESNYLPSLHFTTQLDLTAIDAMTAGSTAVQSVTGNLVLHGIVKSIVFDALVVKHANNSVSFSPRKPIVINSTDFDLNAGVEALRAVMTLSTIGEKVPVYFKMFLNRDNPTNVPAISLATAPSAATGLTGTVSNATGAANLNWADVSATETGFLVRRKGADGRWATASNNAANSVSYLDSLTAAGSYDYKVISYTGSVPAPATSALTLVYSVGSSVGSSSSAPITSVGSSSSAPITSSRSSSSAPITSVGSSSSAGFLGNATTGGNIFKTKGCAGCHEDPDGDGVFAGVVFNVNTLSYPNVASLSAFISQQMFPRVNGCTDANCADHLAAFLWSLKGRTQTGVVACDTSSPVKYGMRSVKLLTSFEYQNSLQALFNRTLPANFGSKELANPDKLVANLPNHLTEPVSEARLLSYKKNAEDIAAWAITNSAVTLSNCSDTTSANCATSFIDNFAYLAFRRPLTNEEKTEYSAIVRNGSTGLRWAIQTVLMSPQFLYRTELGIPVSQARSQSWGNSSVFQTADGTAYALDPYEFASSLAYMYTGSAPDRTLLSAAANGQLENATSLGLQIDRLLDSDLGKAQIGRFAGMWFRTDSVVGMTRTGSANFNQAVKDSMAQEIREIYKYAFYNNLPFTDIYTGDFTMLNSTLSSYYGIQGGGTSATDWRMVNTANSKRGGVLASGAFMTVNAHAGRTSPIKRAVHVRQDMLCQNIPLPTSFVDNTGLRDQAARDAQVALEAGNLTTTQFYDMQTAVPGTPCAQCHNAIINPLFAVDDFDHLGMPRTVTNGKITQKALDLNGDEARSNLVEVTMVNNGGRLFGANGVGLVGFNEVNNEKDTGSPGIAFTGSKDLGKVMVANDLPGVDACLIQKSFRFATGYSLSTQFQDTNEESALTTQQQGQLACVSDALKTRLSANNGNPRAMLKELGMSNIIRFRR
jgi:polyisoprenoid-binding protein YceI